MENNTPSDDAVDNYVELRINDLMPGGHLLSLRSFLRHIAANSRDQQTIKQMQLLEVYKDRILVDLNDKLTRDKLSIAIYDIQRLRDLGVDWPELSALLDNQKSNIIKLMLARIYDPDQYYTGKEITDTLNKIKTLTNWEDIDIILDELDDFPELVRESASYNADTAYKELSGQFSSNNIGFALHLAAYAAYASDYSKLSDKIISLVNDNETAIRDYLDKSMTYIRYGQTVNTIKNLKKLDVKWPWVDRWLDIHKDEIIKFLVLDINGGADNFRVYKIIKNAIDLGLDWDELEYMKDELTDERGNPIKESIDIKEAVAMSPKTERQVEQAIVNFEKYGVLETPAFMLDLRNALKSDINLANVIVANKQRILRVVSAKIADNSINYTLATIRAILILYNVGIKWPELVKLLNDNSTALTDAVLHLIVSNTTQSAQTAINLYYNLRRVGVDLSVAKPIGRIVKSAMIEYITNRIDAQGLTHEVFKLVELLAKAGIIYKLDEKAKTKLLDSLNKSVSNLGITRPTRHEVDTLVRLDPTLKTDITAIFNKHAVIILTNILENIDSRSNEDPLNAIAFLSRFGITWPELTTIADSVKGEYLDFNDLHYPGSLFNIRRN